MHLQNLLKSILLQAVARCQEDLGFDAVPEVTIERPKRPEHGDFACNIALALARVAKRKPRDLAEAIVERIVDPEGFIASTEIAGPGFINIRLSETVWYRILGEILHRGEKWGSGDPKASPRVLIEFVSANPTGPLHVGHGRGAVVGDALARLLRKVGYDVTTEYYLNDAGSQVQKLARSIQARALELLRERDPSRAEVTFPQEGYPGEYVVDVARQYLADVGEPPAGELTEEQLAPLIAFGVEQMQRSIADTCRRLAITFDVWFSEKSLHDSGALQGALDELGAAGHLYEEGGARWFRSTAFGDEKDRVVVRDSGEPTYFAADIAYHRDKYERGFDHLINIWGADHHGYIPRMKGAAQALGRTADSLEVLLVQFVALLKGGEKLQQGKRLGQFVTVDEVVDQVGADVARYFFLERKFDAQVDFDLEVALSEDPRVNPAKYAQYGHARACSILAKAERELGATVPEFDAAVAARLTHPDELAILRRLAEFPLLVEESAAAREPHRIVTYLHDLARAFQSYYTRLKREQDPVLPPASVQGPGWEQSWDMDKMNARLMWVDAIRIVSRAALTLLGLEAPTHMARLEEPTSGGEDA
ncbi:MAG: arginine--tRNA ligase [bacterium]